MDCITLSFFFRKSNHGSRIKEVWIAVIGLLKLIERYLNKKELCNPVHSTGFVLQSGKYSISVHSMQYFHYVIDVLSGYTCTLFPLPPVENGEKIYIGIPKRGHFNGIELVHKTSQSRKCLLVWRQSGIIASYTDKLQTADLSTN